MTAPMQAYAVTLVFADGSIVANTPLASCREAALAGAVQQAFRDNPALADIAGFSVQDLTAEWMRVTLRLIEGQPSQVVSLVSDNLRAPTVGEALAEVNKPFNSPFRTGPYEGDPA